MTRNDLRRKNARLRDQIAQVVEKDPKLRGVTEGIALRQDRMWRSGRIPRTNTRQAAGTDTSHDRASPGPRPLFRHLTSPKACLHGWRRRVTAARVKAKLAA